MKGLFLGFPAMIFLIACGSNGPDSSRRRYLEHHSPSSGDPESKSDGLLSFGDSANSSEDESEGSDDDLQDSDSEASLSMEEAGKRAELRRACKFKADHILNDEDQVRFFKINIIIRGEEEFFPLREIIKEKEITGWRAWFEWADFKIMNSGENKVTFHNEELIVPYKYDRNEEYGDWCPSEGPCIVRIIYRGVIKPDKGHSGSAEKGQKTLAGWQSMGDLVAKIQFAGKVLDFSACDSVSELILKKSKN